MQVNKINMVMLFHIQLLSAFKHIIATSKHNNSGTVLNVRYDDMLFRFLYSDRRTI